MSKKEIPLRGSGLRLHIADAIYSRDCVRFLDPGQLSRTYGETIHTCALYYGEKRTQELGSDDLVGVKGFAVKHK